MTVRSLYCADRRIKSAEKEACIRMFKVIKNKGNILKAYRLGSDSPVLSKLIAEGKVVLRKDGRYEIFSREVQKAGAEHGELASAGDYIKLDGTGAPYPNDAAFFEANHKHLSGDVYEQLPKILCAWDAKEPMCEEIRFLVREKGLILDPTCPERYYTVPLWGTREAGDIRAVLIFYSIFYRDDGTIADASFNLVERKEFEETYSRCQEPASMS